MSRGGAARRGLVGRGDLARILAPGGEAERDRRIAQLLGYDREAAATTATAGAVEAVAAEQPAIDPRPLDAVPFFYPVSYRSLGAPVVESPATEPDRSAAADLHWEPPTGTPPDPPLAPWRMLEPRLRQLLAPLAPGRDIDVARAVDEFAKLSLVDRWPGRRRSQWTRRLVVVLDRSQHLVPFWKDQEALVWRLRHWLPFCEIRTVVFDETSAAFRDPALAGSPKVGLVDGADPILVLGDLGTLAPQTEAAGFWAGLGHRLGRGRALALSPVAPELLPTEVRSAWRVVGWDGAGRPVPWQVQQAAAGRLLRLLAPAVRIETGLLRALRCRLLPDAAASVEALVWRSPAMAGKSSVAGVMDPETARRLRGEFEREPAEDRRHALALLRQWRAGLPREIWFEEVIELASDSSALLPAADVLAARAYFDGVAARGRADGAEALGTNLRAWLSRVGNRTISAWQDRGFREAVWPVMWRDADFVPPVAPGGLPPGGEPVGPVALSLAGDRLRLQAGIGCAGSALALLASDDGLVEIEVPDSWEAVWGGGGRPGWVSAFGEDGYGRWAELTFRGTRQRLRWIPPGRFLMGSPEHEEGRWDDEGPQVEITFAEGFWLFDTAVTQALYEAVIRKSPSRFKRSDRPVEGVSWSDAQAFIERLNRELPGLELRLPAEAEWEYACRAGTTAPYVFGDEARAEDIHFGGDATVGVSDRPANPWGLCQMLGNVEEWCADAWSDGHAATDLEGRPRRAEYGERRRVVRGGSWRATARLVRAAVRRGVDPGARIGHLGFRCAGGRVLGGGGRDARREGEAGTPGRVVEPRPGVTGRARLAPGRSRDEVPLPAAPFIVRTDRAELGVGRLTRSDLPWADAIGRDRFGLWSEFTVSDVVTRLRWIPPGRFLMGSPADEPGRFDNEGPQVEVVLPSGYWLMEAPVTQALWAAVKSNNPSRFVSPDRPVEQVNWGDVQGFIGAVNARCAGLDLRLPSEAEWEHACRAGMAGATYAGAMKILGTNNAPVLDGIAWYGGNSGVRFELDNGYDSSGWPEKQHEHASAGTRPVRLKAPNGWGLHDMLGNVWEWCADAWSASHAGADPHGRARPAEHGGRERVVRGGSWGGAARRVRAAFRGWLDSEARRGTLGFRCAGGRVPDEGGRDARLEGAERAGTRTKRKSGSRRALRQ